jgi:hypothetical protein
MGVYNEYVSPDSPIAGYSLAVEPFGCDTTGGWISMTLCFPVGLYLGFDRQGQITFRNFHVRQPPDYTCEPANVLALSEAKDLFHQMRRFPLSDEGMIGKYTWRA